MSRSLWFRLVLLLAAFAAGALVLHTWWDFDGLLVNLATELLGIVVTVAYVDWVLKRHEADRWSGTDARVSEGLKVFINAAISGIRLGLCFGPDIMNETECMSGDPDRGHQEVLRIAQHVLDPAVRVRLEVLDETGWRQLSLHLQSIWTEAERLLDRFSHRLEPRQVELLLDIQSTVQSALFFWQTFPDLAGVPIDRLPDSKTPPTVLQSLGYDSTADGLRRVMRLARELSTHNKRIQ